MAKSKVGQITDFLKTVGLRPSIAEISNGFVSYHHPATEIRNAMLSKAFYSRVMQVSKKFNFAVKRTETGLTLASLVSLDTLELKAKPQYASQLELEV